VYTPVLRVAALPAQKSPTYSEAPLRNFRFQIIFRVGMLFLLVSSLAVMLSHTQWRVTPIVFGILILFSLMNLIYFIEATNRTLTDFLNSIYYQDFATKVPANDTGKSFRQLSSAYKLITDSFRRISYQKEEHLSLLEAVVDHLRVAILCVDDNGHIKLFNKAAKVLFKTPHMHHVDGLKRVDNFIYHSVSKLVPGEQQLVAANIKGDAVSLAVVNNEFRVADKRYRLLSFHNIRDELEQKESEAWQKLIRVLAHEIMNSATPILSLSASIKSSLSAETGSGVSLAALSDEDQRDLIRSLDSIESRSKGLIHFVDAYRGLTQIPEPKVSLTELSQLLTNVTQSLMHELTQANVTLSIDIEPASLLIKADPQQIEQVLINLLRNAVQALVGRDSAKIVIRVTKTPYNKIQLDVEDNGCGIAEENLANIFMPFYTTKTDGTGVGLSISRQIMFMNRGLLTVESQEGMGSCFRLEFSV
jgi:nitrogen fixation/metabolism regulation signal transduction histidine kinase